MNRLSNSDVRITSRQAFSFQRSNDRSIQVKHPIKQNRTSLKKSINSESHLHFNSAFTYIDLNPSRRLNAYFSLIQWPTRRHNYWSKQTFRADCLNQLLAFIINPDEASFPCFARKAFEVFQFPKHWIGYCVAHRLISANHLNIIPMPLNQTLMHGWWHTTVYVNPVMTKE